jgi:hypothetical protein
MFHSIWEVAAIWLVAVIALLSVALWARTHFLRSMGGSAAVIVSGVPALFDTVLLVRWLFQGTSIYYGEKRSLLDLDPPAWAVLGIPWIATLLAIWLLVRQLRKPTNSRGQ